MTKRIGLRALLEDTKLSELHDIVDEATNWTRREREYELNLCLEITTAALQHLQSVHDNIVENIEIWKRHTSTALIHRHLLKPLGLSPEAAAALAPEIQAFQLKPNLLEDREYWKLAKEELLKTGNRLKAYEMSDLETRFFDALNDAFVRNLIYFFNRR